METGYNTISQVNHIKFPETGYTIGIEYQNGYIRTVNGTENIFTATGYTMAKENLLSIVSGIMPIDVY